ncbi:26S proteasome non-ATPase regulatory subunit 9 [Forsythia ovata]|uniref:26S proteasome non-ATPase regulatory subunit 9 n=1 Tax=Forsythia ovata TaxID=205694 RepID=A0ABD1U8Q5_9LAMI
MVGTNLKAEIVILMEKRSGIDAEMNVIIQCLCHLEGPGLSAKFLDEFSLSSEILSHHHRRLLLPQLQVVNFATTIVLELKPPLARVRVCYYLMLHSFSSLLAFFSMVVPETEGFHHLHHVYPPPAATTTAAYPWQIIMPLIGVVPTTSLAAICGCATNKNVPYVGGCG